MLIGTAKLTNASPSAYVDVSSDVNDYQLIVTDSLQPNIFYAVDIISNCPVVVPIPQTIGDPIVLTVQVCVGTNIITSTFHSSAMRDALMTVDPKSNERHVSLSPRRTTSWDESAVMAGMIGNGQAIASSKKTLLYLEDSKLVVAPTLNQTIVAGVVPAIPLNDQGEPLPDDSIAIINEYKVLLTDRAPANGPNNGSYIICSSKSEVLENEKKKKSHKRQLHATNLGLLRVSNDALTKPIRVRASLLDLQFQKMTDSDNDAESGEKVTDPSELTKFNQKAVLAFVGILEETSREIFNETGLIACTLEGKLFKPMSSGLNMGGVIAAAAAKAAATVDGTTDPNVGSDTESEHCVAVKMYCSLVPSEGFGEDEEAEENHPIIETFEGQEPADEKHQEDAVAGDDKNAQEEHEEQEIITEESRNNNGKQATDNGDVQATGNNEDSNSIDEARAGSKAHPSVENSISLGVVEKEIREWENKQTKDIDEPIDDGNNDFNVVSESIPVGEDLDEEVVHNAADELPGSSVLNVPNKKLSREDLLIAKSADGQQLTPLQVAMEEQVDLKMIGGYSPTAAAAAAPLTNPQRKDSRDTEEAADSLIQRIVSGADDPLGKDHWSVGHSVESVDTPKLQNLQSTSAKQVFRENEAVSVASSPGSRSMSARLSSRTEVEEVGRHSGDDIDAVVQHSASVSSKGLSKLPKKKEKVSRPFGEDLDSAAVMRGVGGAAAVNSNAAVFAEVVRSELNEKQKLIEQLMKEVSVRTEAIQVVGKDIREQREENLTLQNKIKELEKEKQELLDNAERSNEATEQLLRTPNKLSEMSNKDIILCVNNMRQRLNNAVAEKLSLQKAIGNAKAIMIDYGDIKKKYKQLQEAHVEQESYIRKMSNKISKIEAYKHTILTQEKVISKMQRIIETKMKSNKGENPILAMAAKDAALAAAIIPPPKSSRSSKPPTPQLTNMVPEAKLIQAQEEINELNEKIREIEQELYDAKLNSYTKKGNRKGGAVSGSSTARDSVNDDYYYDDINHSSDADKKSAFTDVRAANSRIDELDAELTAKNYRIEALERQLETSTKDYSKEIARLRTKLFELEISASMAAGANDDYNDDDTALSDDARLRKMLGLPDDYPLENQANESANAEDTNNEVDAVSHDPQAHTTKHFNSAVSLPSVSSISMSRPPTQFAMDGNDDADVPIPTGSARSAAQALHSADTEEIEQSALKEATKSRKKENFDTYPYNKGSSDSIDSDIDNIPTPSFLISPAQSIDTGSVKVAKSESVVNLLETVAEHLVDSNDSNKGDNKESTENIQQRNEVFRDMNAIDGMSARLLDDESLKNDPERYRLKQSIGLDESGADKVRVLNEYDGKSDRMREDAATQEEQELLLQKKIDEAEAARKAAENAVRKKVTSENAVNIKDSNLFDGRSERMRDQKIAAEEIKQGQDHAAEVHQAAIKQEEARKAAEEEAARKAAEEEEAQRKRLEEKVDKVVQVKVDIKHADSTSLKKAKKHNDKPITLHPSTMNLKQLLEEEKKKEEQGHVIDPAQKYHPINCGRVTMTIHYIYNPETEESTFNIRRLHLSNFTKDDIDTRFHPYLHLRFTTAGWSCKTNPLESKGMEAEWHFDSKGFSEFDKQFKISNTLMEEDGELLIFMKKLNTKAHEDFLIGFTTIDLNDIRELPSV